jgi:predicted GIY-YIG superfamily endonuclease
MSVIGESEQSVLISLLKYLRLNMWYVYVLKSESDGKPYIGSTNNLKRRIYQHNSGNVDSTKPKVPLQLQAYITVQHEDVARSLEQYLKTGSGHAFLYKRILNPAKL